MRRKSDVIFVAVVVAVSLNHHTPIGNMPNRTPAPAPHDWLVLGLESQPLDWNIINPRLRWLAFFSGQTCFFCCSTATGDDRGLERLDAWHGGGDESMSPREVICQISPGPAMSASNLSWKAVVVDPRRSTTGLNAAWVHRYCSFPRGCTRTQWTCGHEWGADWLAWLAGLGYIKSYASLFSSATVVPAGHDDTVARLFFTWFTAPGCLLDFCTTTNWSLKFGSGWKRFRITIRERLAQTGWTPG